MARLTYIGKRILQMIFVLFVVTIFIFVLVRLIPGDPADILMGDQATEADIQAYRVKMGLDQSIFVQFMEFLKGLVHLDFDNSLLYKVPCTEMVASKIMITIKLTLVSIFFSLLISIPLGFAAGLHQDKAVDQIGRILSLLAISMPSFFVGLVLMIVFSVKLSWLPAGGWAEGFWGQFKSLLLPGFAQALMTAALLMRNLRNSVIEIKSKDYIDFANSKGLSNGRIRTAYIMKNSLVSTITLLSTRIAYMLGGSVVIESVFSLPGIGKLTADAIFSRDYPMIQCLVFTFAVIVVVINLVNDIVYSFIDPRITL